MDEKRFKNTLKLYDEFYNYIIKLFGFVKEFQELRYKEKLLLPYHLNVIDELHIDENAHSRILLKLLQYQNTKSEYVFLDSLVDYIKKASHSFSPIQFNHPIITQEEARIDLWIRDRNTEFSVIFENKIYNAKDQEAQLSRYIDKTIEENFKENNIFVVYLSSKGQEPDSQSWGDYKNKFKERYINLSFSKDILEWLKDDVLPNIQNRDTYLDAAVRQYIDYLEGLFSLRTINKPMNMKLDKLIESHFELDKLDDTIDKIKALRKHISNMQEVINSVDEFKERLRQKIFNEWKKKTQSSFPELHPNENEEKHFTDVSLIVNNKKVVVFINEYDNYGLYCQVEYDKKEANREIAGTWIEELKDILPKDNTDCVWKYLDYDNYDEVYNLFCQVIERIKNRTHQNLSN